MSTTLYPTGVENHGGSLRIWFKYKGQRVRENLGVPDTAKNRKVAGEIRASVCFAIKMGRFDYAEQFPESVNLKKFGEGRKDISLTELAKKWLEFKQMEISGNSHHRYSSVIKNVLSLLGPKKQASAVTKEDLMVLRKELLTGCQLKTHRRKNPVMGRTVPTVNYYMITIGGMFQFAADNGYIEANPFSGVKPLKKAKVEPDPLSSDEFSRLIDACPTRQAKNLWTLAFYTGVRHGELISLAWEDVDLKAGTLTVRRNLSLLGQFTLPKTDAGTDRVIHLVEPALKALRDQAELTRLGKQHQIEIKLREYGRTTTHPCTFIFCPQITSPAAAGRFHYAVGSLRAMWEATTRRAGIRYRKAYQTRHTFACWLLSAGANPTFIAAQMGHSSAQMVYQVYGAWMPENSIDQVEQLNRKLSANATLMPQRAINDV